MVKNNVRKIIVCLISVVMVLAVTKASFATGGSSVLDELQKQNASTSLNSSNAEEIPEGEKQSTLQNPSASLNANQNSNSNTNLNTNSAPTTTPYTGIGDYSSIVFIAIFAVSAVYAYKKIREYNA